MEQSYSAASASSTRPPSILDALEGGPLSLAALVAATGLARPTAHRLAIGAGASPPARPRHAAAGSSSGPGCRELAAAAGEDRLLAAAGPVLTALRDATGESAQLYRRQGDERICVAAAERLTGLRDTVPVGSVLTMHAGSAAQVLLAWEDPDRIHRGLRDSHVHARRTLAGVRRRGWAQSVGRARAGRGVVSAPGARAVEQGRGRRRRSPGRWTGWAGVPGRQHAQAVIDAAAAHRGLRGAAGLTAPGRHATARR